MKRILVLLILVLSVRVARGVSGFETALISEPPLLREGFVLRGIDGRLSSPDSNDSWFFELAADVNDFRDVLEAGTKVQMLPSSTLERMIDNGRSRSQMTFRLWNGRVTRYKGENFIFPSFFLPVRQTADPEPKKAEEIRPQAGAGAVETPPEQKTDPPTVTSDPNDVLDIPDDLYEKLRAVREIMAARERRTEDRNEEPTVEPNQPDESRDQPERRSYRGGSDSVFVNRTGFIVACDDGSFIFELDSLGLKVRRQSLHLLPCEALELAEQKISADFEPIRFRVAGILTHYQDTGYLLLHKATPTYSHGNFGR